MSAPTVHVREVAHRTSARFELAVPSLAFSRGVTAILGLNGSGKTTLLRLLATVVAPAEGEVIVDGVSLTDASLVAVRRRLGYLPQDDSVPRRLTVFDHVDLVAVMREIGSSTSQRRSAVYRALREVDLTELASERCGRLSGGQRRRVALAAALTGDADLLVLDEPDAHLDGEQLDRLTTALRSRAQRATIVIATHNESWAAEVADRVIHLTNGQVTP